MHKRSLSALVILNVILLITLIISLCLPPAPAIAQRSRTGGNYALIAGNVSGRSNQSGVYIIDTSTSKIVTLLFSASNNRLTLIDQRTINNDQAAPAPTKR